MKSRNKHLKQTKSLVAALLAGLFYAGAATAQVPVGVPGPPAGIPVNFGLTGSWVNPQHEGQGFSIEVVMNEGEPAAVVVYWFTFAGSGTVETSPGGPATVERTWFVGVGQVPEEPGAPIELAIFQASGGQFAAQGGEVVQEQVGTALLEFFGCGDGNFIFDITLPNEQAEQAAGEILIERLTPAVVCTNLLERLPNSP